MISISKILKTCLAATLLCTLSSNSAVAQSYPAAGQFDNYYTYTSADFKLLDSSYSAYLPSEFDFEIKTTFNQATGEGTVNVLNFLLASTGTEYNEATGVLTLNSVYFKPQGVADYLGIAPVDGGWKGMAGLTANKLKWQIGENGSITIPDFDIVTFNGSTVKATIAQYRNGSVKVGQAPGPGDDKETSFEGTYPLKGTKYTYVDGVNKAPETEALNFDLVINDNNQIISIAGYTLDKEQISYNRNHGVVEGNSFILEAAPFNGVSWQQVPSPQTGPEAEDQTYTESYLFGGPSIYSWNQLDPNNKIVFTKEEDGSYVLAPFTLWHRYPTLTEDNNVQMVAELVFKWDDTPYVEVGNPSIAGYWEIPLNAHYQGSYSLNEIVGKYEATVDGSTVKFTSVDSDYSIIGTFVDETTVQFSKAAVVPAIYSLWQVPYINTTGTNEMEDLTEETFSAIFDPVNGTLTFPQGSGLLYGRFDSSGKLSYWDDAFDFNGIGKKIGDFGAEITIVADPNTGRSITWELDGSTLEASFAFEIKGFEMSNVKSWKVSLTESFSDKASETDWTETSEVDAVVVNNVASFTLTDLATGHHDFTLALVAYDSSDEVIAISNSKALSFDVGANIAIRAPKTEIDGADVMVTFDAICSGFNADAASFKAMFIDNNTVTEEYAGDTIITDATIEDGVVTALLTDLEEGVYNLSVILVAYEGEEEIAQSNRIEINVFTIDLSGIESIDADNMSSRYYNLQGVEIANPEKGQILIKVQNGKASKVLVK